MERSPSEVSIGFGEVAPSSSDLVLKAPPNEGLPREAVYSQSHIIPGDVFAVVVICTEHKRMALQRMANTKCYFLPWDQHRFDEVAIEKVLRELLKKTIAVPVKGKTLLPKLVELCRIELPRTAQYLTRYIFSVQLDNHAKSCCTETESVTWMCLQEIMASLQSHTMDTKPSKSQKTIHLWGLECLLWAPPAKAPKAFQYREISVQEMLAFLDDKNDVTTLLNNLGYEKSELRFLLNEFIIHCYPAEAMSFPSFCRFLAKIWPIREREPLARLNVAQMFNAFDFSKRLALSFRDLVLGLALMDDTVVHWAKSGCENMTKWLSDMRLQFIFSYYDFNCDGELDDNELLRMLNDYAHELDEIDQMPAGFSAVENRRQAMNELMAQFGQKNAAGQTRLISVERLREALEKGLAKKLKVGDDADLNDLPSVVCHIPDMSINMIADKFAYSRMRPRSEHVAFCSHDDWTNLTCQSCRARRFCLSSHFIRLTTDGEIADIGQLVATKPGRVPFVANIPETDICLLANDMILKLLQVGQDLFHLSFLAPEGPSAPIDTEYWYYDSKEEKIESMKKILLAVQDIFAKEKRVIELESPCYVFGDLHGNLKELLTFSHAFWRSAPFMAPAKCLFLGDYVDRGHKGVEVVLYLFCYKILAPQSFFLLRGNHEVRHTQENFTFLKECTETLSVEMWQMINDCFDRMPFAAIVDGRLFASHGGIPASVNTIDQLYAAPCPMRDPEEQAPEVHQILWNDPIDASQMATFVQHFVKSKAKHPGGFLPNVKRNTAYLYNEEAVIKFMRRNQFDYILRAHEVFEIGFQFFLKGRVLSVFSSSNYDNGRNASAVLFVKQHRIRVVRMERESSEKSKKEKAKSVSVKSKSSKKKSVVKK